MRVCLFVILNKKNTGLILWKKKRYYFIFPFQIITAYFFYRVDDVINRK